MTQNTKIKITAPGSRFYEGPYGRLFPNLDPWSPALSTGQTIECAIKEITDTMLEENSDLKELEGTKLWSRVIDLNKKYDAENVPAGYTYFGQFIDHDITFDPASSLMRRNDPDAIHNFRTPRLDLDSMYGKGPGQDPHLYTKAKPHKFLFSKLKYELVGFKKFKLRKINDLEVSEVIDPKKTTTIADIQRNAEGTAIICDKRNDENLIVAQLHLVFQLAHNTLIDRALKASNSSKDHNEVFSRARNTLRWLYQWIVWYDFLKRICDPDIHAKALIRTQLNLSPKKGRAKANDDDKLTRWELGFEDIYCWKHQPFMPIEFSVAAYRLGHSMVRNVYETNSIRGAQNPLPIFGSLGDDSSENLKGGRHLPLRQAIQWDWFVEAGASNENFPQKARLIDTKLSRALFELPEEVVGEGQSNLMQILAFRNLLRGYNFGLPRGTDVAKRLGVKPIDIKPEHDALWYYILREAEEHSSQRRKKDSDYGQRLGKVGSIIVCSTFAGLLKGDPNSFFNVNPSWSPDNDSLLNEEGEYSVDEFDLSSIVRLSGLNPNSIGIED